MTNSNFLRAWILLALAIAVHVTDEAMTGFLSVYNPTALALRERFPWLPIPVFRFDVWLGGLVIGIIVLLLLSRFVARGSAVMRPIAFVLSILMIGNGVSHIAGTILGRTLEGVRFPRPMPGFYSSPFLLAASIYLLWALRMRCEPRP